jgi:GT2 family glycosyltransferase
VLIYLASTLGWLPVPSFQLTGEDVAVVVTTYNRPTALSWVLASLSTQTVMPAQIVVADDGSGPETRELIQAWTQYFQESKSISVISHVWQEDLGFRAAMARNLAVRRAQRLGEPRAIIFMDGDCVAPEFFVQNHLSLLTRGTMVAGGRGLLSQPYSRALEIQAQGKVPSEIVPKLKQFLSPYRLWLAKACDRYFPMQPWPYPMFNHLRDRRAMDERLVRTCNLSVWSEDFDRVSGFDESFVGWGLEDTEFAVRLISEGVRVRSGRFATNVFHLWHPERSRVALESNAQRLESTRRATVSMTRL